MATREALWGSGHDESVEVNQRALIDKVLARYSGEFTVFRELLQNSDDAASSTVEIHFETRRYLDSKALEGEKGAVSTGLPDLKSELVHQWRFRNNGMVFRDEDWNRLKKIAEGNPDEEKIGAFGVGFYSLFSVTEEPFVTSGSQWMGFYWKDKKDQLYARRGTLPPSSEDSAEPWTAFEMPLREPAAIPILFDLARFLTSSLTFMVHLKHVTVWFDDKRLVSVKKDVGVAKMLSIPKGLNVKSPAGTMTVKKITSTPLYIDAELARCVYTNGTAAVKKPTPTIQSKQGKSDYGGFFASLFSSFTVPSAIPSSASGVPGGFSTSSTPFPSSESDMDPMEVKKNSVVIHVFSASADVRLDRKTSQELNRATKKNPPSSVKLDLIYTGKDEYDASKQEDEKFMQSTGSVFQGLRADLEGSGSARVFIGHSTGQTTGIGGHVSARFIPTVERESIDFMDRNVSLWNKELLYVGGFLARAAYETEMENIRELWTASAESSGSKGTADEQVQKWLTDRCLHALKFFTFHASTPSPIVSTVMEQSFFSCASSPQHPFLIMSSIGVKPASNVRIPDEVFEKFLKRLPVLPKVIMDEARLIVDSLSARGLINSITFLDVLKELRDRPLSEEEMIPCLTWWTRIWNTSTQGQANLLQIRRQLVEAAVLIVDSGKPDERIVPLQGIQTFVNLRSLGAIIPLDHGAPLPDHTLPVSVSRPINATDLVNALGWHELSVVEWLQGIVEKAPDPEHDLSISPVWCERVLNALARAWPSLARQHQQEVATILSDKACIPTRSGLKVPGDAYFPNAHVFHDLPVVVLPSGGTVKGNLDKVLETLGVRKHVDLQVVFTRMIKTGDWSTPDLIKYLVAVQDTLTPNEIERLKQTAAFPKEILESQTSADKKTERFKAAELYEPSDVLRPLGLPILDWGVQTKWRASSDEAKFLFLLGLRRFPPLPQLIKLASDQKETLRTAAVKYFLDNFSRYPGYDPANFPDLAYIPSRTPDGKFILSKPMEVFVDPEWSVLGFSVVDGLSRDVALEKLKVRKSPPAGRLVELLEKSGPQDPSSAKRCFEILAGYVSEFSRSQLTRVSALPIVPVVQEDLAGNDKSSSETNIRMIAPKDCYFKRDGSQSLHSKLFVFVDFGTKANAFLSACGTKGEPSVEEIVEILLQDPTKFYRLAGGRESYLIELRNVAVNRRFLSNILVARMKRAAILLGSRRVRRIKEGGKSLDDKTSNELDEEEWDAEYDLLKPDQILIADDINAYQNFGDSVFCAPQEDILEDLYTNLGSPRMSTLIQDDYKTSVEIRDSKVAKEVRSLILERLPLFLHEHTHARTKVQYSWLNSPKNFIVRTFGKLTVTKYLNFGATRLARNQEASAAARKNPRGPIELWLAGNAQIDMYEVSVSLCRVLLDVPKPNDALLFMTILSTDLRALRRRGYNVDRILKQQRIEREAEEEMRKRKVEEDRLVSESQTKMPRDLQSSNPGQLIATQKEGSSAPPTRPDAPQSTNLPSDGENIEDRNRDRSSGLLKSLQNYRKRFTQTPLLPEPRPGSPSDGVHSPPARIPTPNTRPRSPHVQVTPMSSIEANIDQAIAACREERSNLIRNREHMQMVKESLEEGYCDVSGKVGDLSHVGSMSDIKLYVTKDVPQGSQIIQTKYEVIARFIHVIHPLRALYCLPPTSIHIFCDAQGGTIAFNRNASIFLNLRYFEAWHDAQVQSGDLSKAFVSWYFSLAHEIAHNLVQPHNSEHEFYFSTICEKHILGLLRLLSNVPH